MKMTERDSLREGIQFCEHRHGDLPLDEIDTVRKLQGKFVGVLPVSGHLCLVER